jgi:hypothetical protein
MYKIKNKKKKKKLRIKKLLFTPCLFITTKGLCGGLLNPEEKTELVGKRRGSSLSWHFLPSY